MVKFRLIRGSDTDECVDWSDFPPILDIDEWVDNELGKSERDSYFDCYSGCGCIADLKHEVGKWILAKQEQLLELENMFEELSSQLDDDVTDRYYIIQEDKQ